MESIQYEGLPAQKRAHEAFIDKMENIDLEKIETEPHMAKHPIKVSTEEH